MSVPITIPVDARPIFTDNTFTTNFNAITPGKYDFANDPALQNLTVMELNPNSIYLLEGIEFSMSTGEVDMHKSRDPASPSPKLRLTTLREQQELFTGGLSVMNYLDDFEIVLFYASAQRGDLLRCTFEGTYLQRGDLQGQVELSAFLNLIVYEVGSTQWTGRFFDIKTDLGKDLKFRG